MIEGTKSFFTILTGTLVFVIGLIPLLVTFGLLTLSIPEIPRIVLLIVMSLASVYLIIDGFFEMGMHPPIAWTSIFLGAGFTAVAVMSILSAGFAFMTTISILSCLIVIGFLLFIAGFMF